MAALSTELKRDHSVILGILDRVMEFSLSFDERRDELNVIKNKLLEHLEKEDKELYPVLWKVAESDERIKSRLNVFARDMDKISEELFGFMTKHSSSANDEDFLADLGYVVSILKARIMKEENFLLREYDRVAD